MGRHSPRGTKSGLWRRKLGRGWILGHGERGVRPGNQGSACSRRNHEALPWAARRCGTHHPSRPSRPGTGATTGITDDYGRSAGCAGRSVPRPDDERPFAGPGALARFCGAGPEPLRTSAGAACGKTIGPAGIDEHDHAKVASDRAGTPGSADTARHGARPDRDLTALPGRRCARTSGLWCERHPAAIGERNTESWGDPARV